MAVPSRPATFPNLLFEGKGCFGSLFLLVDLKITSLNIIISISGETNNEVIMLNEVHEICNEIVKLTANNPEISVAVWAISALTVIVNSTVALGYLIFGKKKARLEEKWKNPVVQEWSRGIRKRDKAYEEEECGNDSIPDGRSYNVKCSLNAPIPQAVPYDEPIFCDYSPMQAPVKEIIEVPVPYIPGDTVYKVCKLLNERDVGWNCTDNLDLSGNTFTSLEYGDLSLRRYWGGNVCVYHRNVFIDVSKKSGNPEFDSILLKDAFNCRYEREKVKNETNQKIMAIRAEATACNDLDRMLSEI